MALDTENPPYSGLVSVDELRAYMGAGNFTATQNYVAAMTLAGVQQELENYLNRPIQPVQVRELLKPDANNYLNPRIAPIHKVIKFEPVDNVLDGFIISDPPYAVSPMERDPGLDANAMLLDHAYAVVNSPLIISNGLCLGDYQSYSPGATFFVEYIGGYNGYVDAALKLDIIRVAAREMATNHDKSMNLRDGKAETVESFDNRGRGWTDGELAQWDRLRRRIVV